MGPSEEIVQAVTNAPRISGEPRVYRGRAWFATVLAVIAIWCIIWGFATLSLDDRWIAFLFMGIPLLITSYYVAWIAFAEAVAKVELRDDGFSLRLPRYRGYVPFWPVRRLDGQWRDVLELRRSTIKGHMLVVPFNYVLHRVVTTRGEAVLFEPLASELMRNSRGTGNNIPVNEVITIFMRRAGLAEADDGERWGGGFWQNLVLGSQR